MRDGGRGNVAAVGEMHAGAGEGCGGKGKPSKSGRVTWGRVFPIE
jgi:hypothetical protein